MTQEPIHIEKVTSKRTETLFIVLMLIFFLAFNWTIRTGIISGWSIFFICLSAFFMFYALNYQTLVIRVDGEAVKLKFGIFSRNIPFDNISDCFLDASAAPRIGGAGIHFMSIKGRYTAMFNFIEYDRVVVSLRTPKGPVKDVAFSSREPGELMALIRSRAGLRNPS